MNLLSQRLKTAKRELTNLKTAHRRGLGLLKVYTQTVTVQPPSNDHVIWWLTLDVEFDISPYPFVQKYLVRPISTNSYIYANNELEYKSSGWEAEFRDVFAFFDYISLKFTIYSTSPIKSVNYSWSQA